MSAVDRLITKYVLSDEPDLLEGEKLIWRKDGPRELNDTYYADRLWQWDREKYDRCARNQWGIPAVEAHP